MKWRTYEGQRSLQDLQQWFRLTVQNGQSLSLYCGEWKLLCQWSRLSCVLKNVQNIFVNEMTSLIRLLVGFEYHLSVRKTVNKWLYEEWKVCTHTLQ